MLDSLPAMLVRTVDEALPLGGKLVPAPAAGTSPHGLLTNLWANRRSLPLCWVN